jgi:hypothetical protein
MEFPTSLLSIFSKHDGTQAAEDAVVQVPHVLHPTLEIPEASLFLADVIADQLQLQRSSVSVSSLITVTNGGAVARVLATLGPGIWDLIINFQFASNWAGGIAAAQLGIILLEPVSAFALNMVRFFPQAALNSYTDVLRFRYAHTIATGLQLRASIGDTGAGQTNTLSINLIANRVG